MSASTKPLTYEAWRITYQSSEQAARVLWRELAAAQARNVDLERQLANGRTPDLLAKKHTGMRVDYQGLLKQARSALRHTDGGGGLAEMLRQLENHLTELGQRWYAGDAGVVDEILQLYCIELDIRAAIEQPAHPVTEVKPTPSK